ncbi:ArsR/SmtB family transcription factor [Bacillus salacetis]|uniref:ArsR/SmtB family transcription factor n=1 Tax=Bacillus salacetis TaxID=2315464 RepID=UPI003BA29940
MKQNDVCEVDCHEDEKADFIQKELSQTNTDGAAKIFKALSDDTRMKIAYALSLEKELCVCDVARIVGATTATASHHLRLLRNMGLAKYRKEGKLVYYFLDDDHVRSLINIAIAHHKEVEQRV